MSISIFIDDSNVQPKRRVEFYECPAFENTQLDERLLCPQLLVSTWSAEWQYDGRWYYMESVEPDSPFLRAWVEPAERLLLKKIRTEDGWYCVVTLDDLRELLHNIPGCGNNLIPIMKWCKKYGTNAIISG